MNPIILFRADETTTMHAEMAVAARYFNVVQQRHQVPDSSLVIGRYSVLPFYRELAADIGAKHGRLINNASEHEYIANLGSYIQDVEDLTPKTWSRLEDLPEQGPFVLKGQTNSKKHMWSSHMYAESKKEAVKVWLRLRRTCSSSTSKSTSANSSSSTPTCSTKSP